MPSFFEQMETTPNGAASLQITNEMEVEAGESEIQAARHATFPPSDLHGISTIVPRFQELSISAKAATEAERRMTFLAGCRLYPKAIAWSTLLASAIIMEAYDKSLVSNFFGFPEFRRTYGNPVDKNAPQNSNVYEISAAWQSGLNNAALAGEIIGLFANGIITDRIGYRHTSIAALVWLAVWIFLAFFSVNIQTLLASQVLCGITWGIFQTLAATYAADVMPATLRVYLLSSINMCWLLGQLCGILILRGLINIPSTLSYRVPFALQWAFASIILAGIIFAPESPWWLMRHDRLDEAKASLMRLTKRPAINCNAQETMAMMKHTNEIEKYLSNDRLSYTRCFTGTNLRRTEIACVVCVTQAFSGGAVGGYAAYFNEQVGLSASNSFNLVIAMYGAGILGNIVCWFLLPFIGRRRLYISGLIVLLVTLILIGIVDLLVTSTARPWVLGSLLILLTSVYDLTIGPVCYVLVAEIPSTRLRLKTVVLARVAYNLSLLFVSTVTPKMLNPTAWNWKGKACFFFAGTNFLCLVWTYWRLPELFGLSYLEIDLLFEKKARTGKFRELQVKLENAGYFSLARNGQEPSIWVGF